MPMKHLARACLAGAALCLAIAPAGARPPDLPVDTRDECIPQPATDPGELDTRRPCPAPEPACSPVVADPVRLAHARRMYLIAERCRRAGDWEMAENCYQETRLLCPGSEYARKAEQRIHRMTLRRAARSADASEEQEPATDYLIVPEGRPDLLREADHGKMVEAKVLYYVGERCRRGGDLDMAYRCYEEAHRACPQCRHAKKALQRMRRIDEDRQTNARAGEQRNPSATPQASEIRIESFFPSIDPQVVPAFDRLLTEEGQIAGAALDLVEEGSPAAAGAEEEDYLPGPCGDTCPDSELLRLFIEPPARDLVLCPMHGEEAQDSVAPEDLSDWLRQAVRLMGGAGSLRIDAARLGRLMAQGQGAVRALGCAVVHECGRAYVVYPARPR